jgi:hypothetical protein
VAGYTRVTAASGLVFAALFVTSMVLVHHTPGPSLPDDVFTRFYTTGDRGLLVAVGVYLVPFAGIAFIWHLVTFRALVRARATDAPDIPRGLQLVSGVGFVLMLFAGTSAAGTAALLVQLTDAPLPPVSEIRTLLVLGYGLVFVYGVRMAGMFMITTTTLARSAGLLPIWLTLLGYAVAALLLISATFEPALMLIFPSWIVLVSVMLALRTPTDRAAPSCEE